MKTPVVLIVFNRPDTTEKVFERIAEAKPDKLFLVADGPRAEHREDEEKCSAVRRIIETVEWDCEVFKNYSETNMGCGKRPATGIDWVFKNVEEAIILEDDCLPDPTFFPFCEELLEKYRDDERVMKISGRNDLWGIMPSDCSYFFERIGPCWGWATWRRAWENYDFKLGCWPELRDSGWLQTLGMHPAAAEYWHQIFERTYLCSANVNHWDYQWLFSMWLNNGLSVAPSVNLVRNIGFGEQATHTKNPDSLRGNLPAGNMVFPLRHPTTVELEERAEIAFVETVLWPRILASSKNKKSSIPRRLSQLMQQFLRT